MTAQTLFIMSPDDLQAMLIKANEPLASRIKELELLTAHHKHAYTVKEVAERISYCTKTVTRFIVEGRTARNGKKIRLKAREITTGNYRIMPTDLDAFIAQF